MANTSFDPQWYLQQYPDIAAYIAKGGVDREGQPLTALSHYIKFGAAEGRRPNGSDGGPALDQLAQDKVNMASGGGTPRLDPSNPAAWAAWADKAQAQTAGINRLPRTLGDTSQIGMDPKNVLAAFYPSGPEAKELGEIRRLAAISGLGGMPEAQGADPAMSAVLQQYAGQQGATNLGMGLPPGFNQYGRR